MVDEPLALDEVEHVLVVGERRPGRERHPGRPERDPRGPREPRGLQDVRARVPFAEMRERRVAQRLRRRHDEDAAERRELRETRPMPQQMLDLRGEVEGQVRKLGVHGARHGKRVSRPVQEIRIAEFFEPIKVVEHRVIDAIRPLRADVGGQGRGQQAEHGGQGRHHHRPHAFLRALQDRLAHRQPVRPQLVEVGDREQAIHDCHAEDRDKTHRRRDAKVRVGQQQRPDAAQRQRYHVRQHDHGVQQ